MSQKTVNIESVSMDSRADQHSVLDQYVLLLSCSELNSICSFVSLQVYAEGIHLVYMSANVINSTVVYNSDMLGVVPEDWQDKMNDILDNAYTYGREGISKMVMCPTSLRILWVCFLQNIMVCMSFVLS